MRPTVAGIPWPGPKPITFKKDADEEALKTLVGREEELIELQHACQAYGVVELTAPSGIGKTSFLAGAQVYLGLKGFGVFMARSWSEVMGEYERLGAPVGDPLPLYCLALGLPVYEDVSQLCEALRERDGAPPVHIFDQVEELLRYERDLGAGLLGLIGYVAVSTWIPHVVVSRTEFRDQLRPVEVQGASTWHMLLSELADPEVIREVVEGPVPAGVELGDGVVDRIVEWWGATRSPGLRFEHGDEPFSAASSYGLLHLQALLWDLRRWAAGALTEAPQRLTLADLERYASKEARGGDGEALMANALRAYVEAAVAEYRSESWPTGPRLMLARAAGHLSSAGYKVAQPISTLLVRALQEELGSSRSALDGLARFDIEQAEGRAATVTSLAGRFQINPAGVGRDWTRECVVEEMLAALEGILAWLADPEGPNVLRHYRHGGDPVYELVHDGVAPALDRWAEKVLDDPIVFLGGICVHRGEIFDHDLRLDTFLDGKELKQAWKDAPVEVIGDGIAVAIGDIGWHGLGVHHPDPGDHDPESELVTIEDVVFERCDFTGTLFKGVVFRNVRFVECQMRGVAMLGCRFADVVFERSPMVGAALIASAFERVCFDCAGVEGAMNYVSVERAKPGAEVTIRNLNEIAGLFLVDLMGGSWAVEDAQLYHLALEGSGEYAIQLGPRCELTHLKLDLPGPQRKLIGVRK